MGLKTQAIGVVFRRTKKMQEMPGSNVFTGNDNFNLCSSTEQN